MGISYIPFELLIRERKIKRTQLEKDGIIVRNTIAKLGRDEYVSLEVIDRLCTYFQVPIEAIVKWVPDNKKDPHRLR